MRGAARAGREGPAGCRPACKRLCTSLRPKRKEAASNQRSRNSRKLLTAQAFAELVALFAGHVEVKHEVFDIEPKLRQRFLHQGKNPSPAADRVDDADIRGFQLWLKTG